MIDQSDLAIIIYVENQHKAKTFYTSLLDKAPTLDVVGMTEIPLTSTTRLGILPGDGIVKILEGNVDNPNQNTAYPRCELYLFVDDPIYYYEKAIRLGGRGISEASVRNWGDYVSYVADFDGNIIAFAKRI